jgi:membrane-bound ClpP family serine protease
VIALLAHSPNLSVLAGVVGVFLIYLEINRPGLVLAGAAGLTTCLLCVAALAQTQISLLAVVLLALSAAVLLIQLRLGSSFFLGGLTGLGIFAGTWRLVDGPGAPRVHPVTAIFAGFLLGPGTSLLTAIARRARVNKGLD